MRLPSEPKRFVTLRGDHYSDYLAPGSDYLDDLEEFLAEVTGRSAVKQPLGLQ